MALAAGVLPFATGVGTASADDFFIQFFSKDHTFTAGDGSRVTCSVYGESSLFRESGQDTYDGEALTRVVGEHPSCGITFVDVQVSYLDAGGRRHATGADSVDGDVRWFSDGVAGQLRVGHHVTFDECQADCEISFTTSPK